MSYALLGYALGPFVVLMIVSFLGRPVSIWLDRRLDNGWLRKILLFRWET